LISTAQLRRVGSQTTRTQLRRIEIEDNTSQVRFWRRTGLFKKAFKIALLCDAEVTLLVFSPGGRVYQYASSRFTTSLPSSPTLLWRWLRLSRGGDCGSRSVGDRSVCDVMGEPGGQEAATAADGGGAPHAATEAVYPHPDIDLKKLCRLILEVKLAPCYPGAHLDDPRVGPWLRSPTSDLCSCVQSVSSR
jgi:hypothetical protein